MRDSIFISYSHADGDWRKVLEKMLAPMSRRKGISVWSDIKIPPGAKWKDEIEKALDRTKVAVLLVSPDFLVSEFIVNNELVPILNIARNNGLTVLWVYLRPCGVRYTDLADFQAAHDTKTPLAKLSRNREQALLEICEKIMDACV
jgi:internalin A